MAFDLELTDGRTDTGARAKIWLEEYEIKTNRQPIIYSSPNFLNNILKASQFPWLADYELWLAQYYYDNMSPNTARDQRIRDVLASNVIAITPDKPKPFAKRMPFWQWTAKGKPEDVPGYFMGPGHKLAVDLVFYLGTRQEFDAEFKVGGTVPPGGDDMNITTEMWAQLIAGINATNTRLDNIQKAIEDLDIVNGGGDGESSPPPAGDEAIPFYFQPKRVELIQSAANNLVTSLYKDPDENTTKVNLYCKQTVVESFPPAGERPKEDDAFFSKLAYLLFGKTNDPSDGWAWIGAQSVINANNKPMAFPASFDSTPAGKADVVQRLPGMWLPRKYIK